MRLISRAEVERIHPSDENAPIDKRTRFYLKPIPGDLKLRLIDEAKKVRLEDDRPVHSIQTGQLGFEMVRASLTRVENLQDDRGKAIEVPVEQYAGLPEGEMRVQSSAIGALPDSVIQWLAEQTGKLNEIDETDVGES